MPDNPSLAALAEALPDPLATALAGGLWSLDLAGEPAQPQPTGAPEVAGGGWSESYAVGDGLTARLQLDRGPAGVARLQVVLRNDSAEASAPITALRLFDTRWAFADLSDLVVRSVGGGLAENEYPPHSFRENLTRPAPDWVHRIRSGDDGRSSNRDLDVLQLHCAGPSGGGLVVALEWSAEWSQELSVGSDEAAGLRWQVTVPVDGLRLDPGEELRCPAVHLVSYAGDLDEGGNAFRRYVYDRICPPIGGVDVLPPISYDHWFGLGCEISESTMLRQLDVAAAVGIEYFVLDAGWFAGCGPGYEFSSGTGNWERVDAERFPGGLEPLAAAVQARGLRFGLWFEPERAFSGSDLPRRHPDWFFGGHGDYQLLNLSLPAAQDYVVDLISGWAERLQLRWIRWDFNIGPRPYWQAADRTGKLEIRYTEGLYRVLDELMVRCPDLMIECCASGGRRIDLGTLRRAHTIWISDHTEDPLICHFMQAGASRFLPSHLLNSSVPVDAAASAPTLSVRDLVARFCGAFALNGDIASWPPESVELARRYVAVFGSIRHLLVGDFHPLLDQPTDAAAPSAVQYGDRGGDELLVVVLPGSPSETGLTVRPRLGNAAEFEVTDLIGDATRTVSSAELTASGLRVDVSEGAGLVRLRRLA